MNLDVSNEKRARLIDSLFSRTREGRLDWRSDEQSKKISVIIGSNFIVLEPRPGDFGDIPDYYLQIETPDGKIVEQFSDVELRDAKASSGTGESFFTLMEAIYNIAKRRESGADQALDEALRGLDGF